MKKTAEPKRQPTDRAILVTNTGPMLHLIEAEAIEIMQWAGDIYTPGSVFTELRYHLAGKPLPTWLQTGILSERYTQRAEQWHQASLLDKGEADALALALQLKAHWFLTDDAAARLFAQTLGIEVHGSIGIILWAAAIGKLDYRQTQQTLQRLKQSTLWISGRVYAEAQAAVEQMFRVNVNHPKD